MRVRVFPELGANYGAFLRFPERVSTYFRRFPGVSQSFVVTGVSRSFPRFGKSWETVGNLREPESSGNLWKVIVWDCRAMQSPYLRGFGASLRGSAEAADCQITDTKGGNP